MSRRRRQVKWVTGGFSVALIAGGAVILGSASAAHADVSPGQGSSYAQGLEVAPHDGSLAVGVTLAEALAGHTNSIARAQSQGIDLGAIGTSMTGYNCGSQAFQPNQIPQPLETETGAQGANQGITQQPDPSQGTSQPSFGTYERFRRRTHRTVRPTRASRPSPPRRSRWTIWRPRPGPAWSTGRGLRGPRRRSVGST